jgi:preprotein translocase subunit SecB
MAENKTQPSPGEAGNPLIMPQKIYVKDISFEAPNSPAVFTRDWNPSLSFDLGQKTTRLSDDLFEVVLSLTVTIKCDDTTAYLVEIHQAGIFMLKDADEERSLYMLNVYCPHMLYPYACSAAAEVVTRGGFPQLFLTPVNFEAVYHKRKAGNGDSDNNG